MLNDNKLVEFIGEYRCKQELYKEFSNAIKFILEIILRNNGFQYQVILPREKSLSSLERKLREDKRVCEISRISEIDDLAGCRIIFYLESDIDRVAPYIRQEFEFIKINPRYSSDDYNATHLVVKLNKDRLKLTEYSKFENMKCEVQLTTVLYHAWSEMAHDIIYKPQKELSEFDQRSFKSLKKQFSNVMRDHIKQASYSFEFIHREFERIRQGKKVFDPQFLKGIIESKSSNEIFENLKLLSEYVKEFGDKTPKELNIINIIKQVLKITESIETQPIKTLLGDYSGYSYSDITNVCLEILDTLKYFYSEEILQIILKYSCDSDDSIKKKALEILSELAEYNIKILEKAGYHFQLMILKEMEKWNDKKLIRNFESLLTSSEKLLKTSYKYNYMSDYKTFTLSSGVLTINNYLKDIRERSINLLKKMYSVSEDIALKRRVLKVLQRVEQTPWRGKYGEDLLQMVIDDTNDLINYYIEILPEENFLIIKEIEEQAHRFAHKFTKEKLNNIEKLQSMIASNSEYDIFRTFVGHDTDFLEEIDWKKAREIRKNKIQEFVNSISKENFEEWRNRILSIINPTNTPGDFNYFAIFLYELSKQKPDIALILIKQNEKELEPFLANLVAGIWKSNNKNIAKNIITLWAAEGKHLSSCAFIFVIIEEIHKPLLDAIFKKAKEKKDINALHNILNAVGRSYSKGFKPLLISTIKELNRNNVYNWIDNIWTQWKPILKSFTEKDFDVLLKNMIQIPNIDYHAEEILLPISEEYPLKVINFFEKRFGMQAKKKRDEKYDAIPFQLHLINKPLQENGEIIVSEILKWFSKKGGVFRWEANHFLKEIFPAFGNALEKNMISLIEQGGEKNADIVVAILRVYEGETFLHNVCKEFVKKYPKYKSEMFSVLSNTGVVSGEYGFVEEFKRKKEEIKPWKKDKCKKVQSFAKDYIDYLNKRIAYEKKRADEDIELRKRRFES